jgi:hypothetical protein
MLGSRPPVRRSTRGEHVGRRTAINLEPGPDRISPPKRVYGLSRTGLRKIHLSGAKRRLLQAILGAIVRASGCRSRVFRTALFGGRIPLV